MILLKKKGWVGSKFLKLNL